jgi:predicted RNA-binding Zn-ribbon protein involved in translation (DUF1610 family)
MTKGQNKRRIIGEVHCPACGELMDIFEDVIDVNTNVSRNQIEFQCPECGINLKAPFNIDFGLTKILRNSERKDKDE